MKKQQPQIAHEEELDSFVSETDKIPRVGDSVRYIEAGNAYDNAKPPEYMKCKLQGYKIVVYKGVIVEVEKDDEEAS